jgi:hypothetical protein
MSRILVANEGGIRRYLGRQFEGGQLTHYRSWKEDLRPAQRRSEIIAKGSRESRGGMQYLGSVPRIVIDDWLRRQGKTWHDYATDADLKAKFLAWFKTDYSRFMADSHRERSLSINRSRSGRLATPSMGSRALAEWRQENAA